MAEFLNPWEKYYNKWSRGNENFNRWADKTQNNWSPEKQNIIKAPDLINCLENSYTTKLEGLADAAMCLGVNGKLLINTYDKASDDTDETPLPWFFSINKNLKTATRKPTQFESWDDWNNFEEKQKRTITTLSIEFEFTYQDIEQTDENLKSLKKAYKKWGKNFYSVFWGDGQSSIYACNLFVGESIYIWRKKTLVNASKVYYGTKEIYAGEGPFEEVTDKYNIQKGHIAAWRRSNLDVGQHVEIVTSVTYKDNDLSNSTFCTIGAGRSQTSLGTEQGNGTIKCDRLIDFEMIKFFKVNI